MHRSLAGHTPWGSQNASATAGRQLERHRPSAPAIDTQDWGTPPPTAAMMGSGTHSPAPLSAVVQAPGDSGRPGSSSVGTQWEPLQVGLHPAKTVGSNTAGPVQGQ